MHFRGLLVGAAIGTLGAVPALADPVTYVGKLAKLDIVLELTGDPATYEFNPAGRYHYRTQGADIPLTALSRKGGAFSLAEEEACKDACEEGKPGPVGAVWQLTAKNDGQILEGTWKSKKKTLDLKLERVGTRPVTGDAPEKPLDLYNFTVENFYSVETPISQESSPYDYLRLDVPYDAGEQKGWSDASFNYVTDPRTKFPRPRILELAGAASVEAANNLLRARHWVDSIAALSCKSLQYAAFQEYGPVPGGSDGSLGYYDETTSEVTALTPKLISWRESGSIFCGGAHPSNYSDKFVMDIAKGQTLSLRDMFIDVTDDGAPGDTLVKYVRETREKPTDQVDVDFEAECGTDDLIAQYLTASVERDGDELRLVFGLAGLPHVIAACGDDFLEVPAADVVFLLKPEFAALLAK